MARRLAAILSADAVGYSRLMAEDEPGTVRLLSELRGTIARQVEAYGGRVVDAPGDNLLAELPSVVEGVSCAVEIQRLLAKRNAELPEARRMPFRIGVNLGDVIVEDERLYGDGVNVAARLEGLAEPGGVCISGSAYDQVRHRLALGYEDLGPQPVKNMPDPVRVYRLHATPSVRAPRGVGRRALLAATTVVALLGVAVALSWPRPLGLLAGLAGITEPPLNPPLPDKPSLVVLPFANLSDDPEQEWFADGVSEDLITDLSRHSLLFVIASNSAFTYKGRAVDVETVGRELGVRYVVEGSVRRAANRIRVTAQLIDAANGFHRWSQRYDRELAGVFEMQAELAEEIMHAVGVEVQTAEAERLRRKPTDDLSAWESYVKANWHFNDFTRASHARSDALLEQAVALDPDFAAAWALLGQVHHMRWVLAWDRDPAVLERALELNRRALELDPQQAHALVTRALQHLLEGRLGEAETAARRALEVDPNRPGGHFALALVQAQTGRPLDAAESIRRFLRLNPRGGPSQLGAIAIINYATGRTEDAARHWERAWAGNADSAPAAWPLVHIYESQGRHEDAQRLAAAMLEVNPALTAETLITAGMISPAQRQAHLESLRHAGLP